MDPEARDRAYNYLRKGVELYVYPGMKKRFDEVQARPEFKDVKLECRLRLEQVGSVPFGCASLHSDWDFNINLPDWNSQAVARQWYFASNGRKEFVDYMFQWEREWGFKMDVGCIDPMTDLYNVHVNMETMMLHRRGSKLPSRQIDNLYYTTDDRIPEALPPIDLRTWDKTGKVPAPDTVTPENTTDFNPALHVPPISYQHLQWDGYAMRWLSGTNLRGSWRAGVMETENPFQAKYVSDEWADQETEWKEKYGQRYTGYTKIGDKLVENLTPFIVYPKD